MSTITLDRAILNAIAMPISSTPVPAPNHDLITFAEAVITLHNAGMLAETLVPAPVAVEAVKSVTPARQSKPAVKPSKKAVKPVVNTLPNWHGKAMASDEGTRSKNQAKWLTENSKLTVKEIREISMVDASNWRALLSGKITVAQYNLLP